MVQQLCTTSKGKAPKGKQEQEVESSQGTKPFHVINQLIITSMDLMIADRPHYLDRQK